MCDLVAACSNDEIGSGSIPPALQRFLPRTSKSCLSFGSFLH